MQRRALLRGLVTGAPVIAGIAAGAALKSKDYVKEKSETSLEALKQSVEDLRTRFDESDKRNKKLVKAALALAALSLGLDVGAFL